jgi:hypothetical protein
MEGLWYPIMLPWMHNNTWQHNTSNHSPQLWVMFLLYNLQAKYRSVGFWRWSLNLQNHWVHKLVTCPMTTEKDSSGHSLSDLHHGSKDTHTTKSKHGKISKPHYVVAFAHLESVRRHVDQTPVRASPAFAKSSRSQSMQVDLLWHVSRVSQIFYQTDGNESSQRFYSTGPRVTCNMKALDKTIWNTVAFFSYRVTTQESCYLMNKCGRE